VHLNNLNAPVLNVLKSLILKFVENVKRWCGDAAALHMVRVRVLCLERYAGLQCRFGILTGTVETQEIQKFLSFTFVKDLCLFLPHLVLSGGVIEHSGLLMCYAVSIGKFTGTVGLDCLIPKKEALRSVEEPVILQQSTCRNIPKHLDLILYY